VIHPVQLFSKNLNNLFFKFWHKKPLHQHHGEENRGGSTGTSNNCVGEQNCNYLLRKTKLKAIFVFLQRCSMYLKSASVLRQKAGVIRANKVL